MAEIKKKKSILKEKLFIYAATLLTAIAPSSALAQKIAEQYKPESPKKNF